VINITRGLDQAKTLVGKLNKHENDRAVKKFLLERSEKKKLNQNLSHMRIIILKKKNIG